MRPLNLSAPFLNGGGAIGKRGRWKATRRGGLRTTKCRGFAQVEMLNGATATGSAMNETAREFLDRWCLKHISAAARHWNWRKKPAALAKRVSKMPSWRKFPPRISSRFLAAILPATCSRQSKTSWRGKGLILRPIAREYRGRGLPPTIFSAIQTDPRSLVFIPDSKRGLV